MLSVVPGTSSPLFVFALLVGVVGWQGAQSASADIADLRPGEWRELPFTEMRSIFPSRDKTTWGNVGPAAVVMAWGGAAYDSKRDIFIFNGGGHADYGGNEVYGFFLRELTWRRLTDPSPIRMLPSGQYVTLDDTPISAHTYDGLEYLPNVDRIFRNGGAEWRSGRNLDRSAWLFDVEARRWARRSAGGGGYPATAYNPKRGTVYVVRQDGVDEYDPRHDRWIPRLSQQADFLPGVGALDADRAKLITDSYRDGVIVYEIYDDGTVSERTFHTTRGATDWDKKMLALEYDPVRKVLVAWTGDRETAYLDTATLTWRRHANSNSATAPQKASGRDFTASGRVYGRWRYVPNFDLFIGYNNPNGNMWIWKPVPAEAGETAIRASAKALIENAKDGAVITIPPGVYEEAAVLSARGVTIKSHGVRIQGAAAEEKAALVVKGDDATIEGLECAFIRVQGDNGACVRLEAKNLTLRNVVFRDSQSGLLSWNRSSGSILIEDSRFERLGRAHGVYVGRGDTHLLIRRSRFLSSTAEGHEIKSRAARTTIEDSIVASLDGVDSRLIDLPEGGENVIRRNVLAHGPASSNQELIGVGLEGNGYLHQRNSTLVEDNLVLMERRGGNVLLHHRHVSPTTVRIERNKVVGGSPLGGTNTWFKDRKAASLGPYPELPPFAGQGPPRPSR